MAESAKADLEHGSISESAEANLEPKSKPEKESDFEKIKEELSKTVSKEISGVTSKAAVNLIKRNIIKTKRTITLSIKNNTKFT